MYKLVFQKRLLLSLFLFYSTNLLAATKAKVAVVKNSVQTVSAKITYSGDLSGVYQFDGDLGSQLLGSPEKPGYNCDNKAKFQLVTIEQKQKIQLALDLICTIEGQKIEFRPQLFLLDPQQTERQLELPALNKKIKKVTILIQDFSIKKPQKK